MKPENYKLALRRARKAAKEKLESFGCIVYEATDKRRQPVLIVIDRLPGLTNIVYVCLEGEKLDEIFDENLPSNILQEVWVKKKASMDFKIIYHL